MTITSKEVAEMLGKRHDNLLRAIRKYITQLGDEAPKYFSEDPDKGGRLYHITKAGCDLMAGRIIGAPKMEKAQELSDLYGIPLAYMDFSKAGNSTPLRERESEPQIPAF